MNYDFSDLPFDLLLNILNIILLFVIVKFLVYKPVKRFLDARVTRIKEENEKAEEAVNTAQIKKEEYEALVKESEKKAEAIIEEGRRKAELEAEKILEDARKKADEIIEKACLKADAEYEENIAAMREDALNMSFEIAEKLLEHSITSEDNINFAKRFFESRISGGDKV